MADKNNKGISGSDIGVAAGITAAVAAAAAGAYFLYGSKDAPKNRKKISGWMLKAKGEVLDKMEKLKEVNEDAYNKIVDEVTRRYEGIKNVDPVELSKMVTEMKGHWKSINRTFKSGGAKKAVKKVAKSAKKAVKKATSDSESK